MNSDNFSGIHLFLITAKTKANYKTKTCLNCKIKHIYTAFQVQNVGTGCPQQNSRTESILHGYREVQKTFLSKFNQEHDRKLKHRKKTLENKTVVQKMKYNNWNMTWCVGMLTFSFFLKNDRFVIKKATKNQIRNDRF